ncbi:MAG: TonB family protein [Bacteroidales bacterium]|nr:TonB family protein [Bacteroidales bacterium]
MKTKTKQDRLEKQRRTFFLIGIIFALTIVLTAFEWKTYDISLDDDFTRTSYGIIDDEFVEITKHERPEPPKPIVKPVVVLKEVDNNTEVDEIELFNPEAEPLDSVPEFVYIPPEDPDEGKGGEFFLVVEKMPEFPGGEEALMVYLASKTKYTRMAIEAGITGTVYVSFIVEKDGSVSTVELLRGVGGGLDGVALEAIRSMPDWSPGKQRGIPQRVNMKVPFKFKLQ